MKYTRQTFKTSNKISKRYYSDKLDPSCFKKWKNYALNGYWLDYDIDPEFRSNACKFIDKYAVSIYQESDENGKKIIKDSICSNAEYARNKINSTILGMSVGGFLLVSGSFIIINSPIVLGTIIGGVMSLSGTRLSIHYLDLYEDYNTIIRAEENIENIK